MHVFMYFLKYIFKHLQLCEITTVWNPAARKSQLTFSPSMFVPDVKYSLVGITKVADARINTNVHIKLSEN